MGYETNVMILDRGTFRDPERGYFHSLIAHIDLSKCCGDFRALFNKPLDGYFFLPDDGNNHFTTDAYDDPAMEGRIEEVYNWLGKHIFDCKNEGNHPYRRYVVLFNLLEGFLRNKDAWRLENLTIATYGH